jgi:hypothetical protein
MRYLATGHYSLLQDTKKWVSMDTRSTSWPGLKRASIKIVVHNAAMAEQRGVSAIAREGRACDPLLDLAHLG